MRGSCTEKMDRTQTGRGMQGYMYAAPKRRLNKKKFFSMLLLLAVLIAAGIFGVHQLTAKKVIGKSFFKFAAEDEAADTSVAAAAQSLNGKKVVVDAGHGGFDPGATGMDGTFESQINLKVALFLKEALEAGGATVIMTRTDENAIAETKDEDMALRQDIIKKNNPDFVLSIHMNWLEDSTVSGPLVLFEPGSVPGERLAQALQDGITGSLESISPCKYRAEDLFVLRGNTQPSVLIECGFISNEKEEEKLLDDGYEKELANAIVSGLQNFLGQEIV